MIGINETLKSEVYETLAQECFDQGLHLLAKKDTSGAILQFREALRLAPHHIEISIKLADVLANEKGMLKQAEEVLAKAYQQVPQNRTVKSKLAQVRKALSEETPDSSAKTDETDQADRIIRNILANQSAEEINRTCPSCYLVNATNETICRRCLTPLSIERLAKIYNVRSQDTRAKQLQIRDIGIIIIIIVTGLLSVGKKQQDTTIEINPLMPESQGKLDTASPGFYWYSTDNNVHYLLEIDKNGQPLIERYSRSTFYILNEDDLKKLSVGEFYKWRVVPISPKQEEVKYRSPDIDFQVINSQKLKLP